MEIGVIVVHLFSLVSFFTCTRPNRSDVGAIDKPDCLEQVFDQYDILETPKEIFTNDFSMVGHEKMMIFGDLDDFINNFTYYNLHWRKYDESLKKNSEVVWKKSKIYFFHVSNITSSFLQ